MKNPDRFRASAGSTQPHSPGLECRRQLQPKGATTPGLRGDARRFPRTFANVGHRHEGSEQLCSAMSVISGLSLPLSFGLPHNTLLPRRSRKEQNLSRRRQLSRDQSPNHRQTLDSLVYCFPVLIAAQSLKCKEHQRLQMTEYRSQITFRYFSPFRKKKIGMEG